MNFFDQLLGLPKIVSPEKKDPLAYIIHSVQALNGLKAFPVLIYFCPSLINFPFALSNSEEGIFNYSLTVKGRFR